MITVVRYDELQTLGVTTPFVDIQLSHLEAVLPTDVTETPNLIVVVDHGVNHVRIVKNGAGGFTHLPGAFDIDDADPRHVNELKLGFLPFRKIFGP